MCGGSLDQCVKFSRGKMQLYIMCRNQHLVRLYADRNVTARVATGTAGNRFPRGQRSRRKRAIEFLVRVGQNRKEVARIPRFPQPLQHGRTGLLEQSIFFR